MLESERSNNETGTNTGTNEAEGTAPAPTFNGPAQPAAPAVPAAVFQPPQVLFQAPAPVAPPPAGERESGGRESSGRESSGRDSGGRDSGGRADGESEGGRPNRRTRGGQGETARGESTRGDSRDDDARGDDGGADQADTEPAAEGGRATRRTRGRGRARVRETAPADDDLFSADAAAAIDEAADADEAGESAQAPEPDDEGADADGTSGRRRRRRNSRTRKTGAAEDAADGDAATDDAAEDADDEGADADGTSGRRRRRKRRRGAGDSDVPAPDDPPDTVVHVRAPHNPADEVRSIKGSTRLEAKKQRRREGRESGRRRPPVITESEFLARRESVERNMVVRQRGDRTQIAVLEDGVLVEHYVNRTTHASYVGNVYLGKVQNVLPSMEAAFVDIGKGRNAVLYAGEVNFDASGLEGQPRRIEVALKPGQSVIVQVTKDPVGHKGARLTSQISLPGRYLVYVPGASMTGISRKLPDTERTRLKQILKKVTPEHAGVIVRTAAEGAAEAELDRDITRLAAQWESIEKKAKTASSPALLHGEPDLTIRVIRDVFNEDFGQLTVSGDEAWEIVDEYVRYVAPHLADRISRWDDAGNEDAGEDVFAAHRIDEQLAKALDRKVWLPSGGSLVIDRTEAMTVVDVNTGKFTGQGGNLEETVTRNNLEAAEEIVRQLRLRDIGGIVVIDFIDMVLESNRELVLRRLLECLARDRTKHQVAEVTSLGLVQMTRKRVGAGLLEAFSQQCECCNGRGVIVTLDAPAEPAHRASAGAGHRPVPAPPANGAGNGSGNGPGKGSNGSGNGRGRRGNDRRDESRADRAAAREASDAGYESAAPAAQDVTAQDDQALAGAALAATPATVTDTAPAATTPDRNGTGPGRDANGGRRIRRSTSAAGTAFATAVIVEDTPPVAPVTPVSEPAAVSSAASVAESADAEAARPVRRTRTRTGSAVARVTVNADPRPDEQAPAPASPAEQADAPVPPAADAAPFTAEPEAQAEVPTEPEIVAALAEPTVVPASMFDAQPSPEAAPAATETTETAESPPTTAADSGPAVAEPAAQTAATEPADAPVTVAQVPAAEAPDAEPTEAPAGEVTPAADPVAVTEVPAADAPASYGTEAPADEPWPAAPADQAPAAEPVPAADAAEAGEADGEPVAPPEQDQPGQPG